MLRPSLALLACLSVLSGAQAAICAVDPRPAATLLLPYFEHDYATACTALGAGGYSAAFTLHNVSDQSQLGRITLWSTAGIPVLDFYLYLHARQSRRITLYDLLCLGRLPRTGSQVNRDDAVFRTSSPNFTFCGAGFETDVPPSYQTPLTQARRDEIRQALTGKNVALAGGCYGEDHGDDIARGYLTVDDVEMCATQAVDSAAYLQGVLGFDNAWIGGWEQTGLDENVGAGGSMIAIEAAPPGAFADDTPTFYGRFDDFSAVDRREPLPSTWSTGFLQNGSPARTAEWIVWRETPRLTPSPALCNGTSAGGELPLQARDQRGFDAGGQSQASPQAPPAPIGLATQRIPASALESTSEVAFAGALGLGYANLADGTADPRLGQGWVGALSFVPGRFGDLAPAVALDSRCPAGFNAPADVNGPLPGLPALPNQLLMDSYED